MLSILQFHIFFKSCEVTWFSTCCLKVKFCFCWPSLFATWTKSWPTLEGDHISVLSHFNVSCRSMLSWHRKLFPVFTGASLYRRGQKQHLLRYVCPKSCVSYSCHSAVLTCSPRSEVSCRFMELTDYKLHKVQIPCTFTQCHRASEDEEW